MNKWIFCHMLLLRVLCQEMSFQIMQTLGFTLQIALTSASRIVVYSQFFTIWFCQSQVRILFLPTQYNYHNYVYKLTFLGKTQQHLIRMNVYDLCNYFNNFTMFPSVIKDDTLKQKIKEKQWDERFGTQKGIPDYSPLKDKHTKSYRKIITNKKQQNQSENKPKILTTYFQKRMELIQQLYQLHKPNKALIEQYEQLASKYKVPNFYIYYTLLPLLSPSVSVTQYLFKQKKQTKEQSSHFHKISVSVRAREECLQRLRKTLGQLQESQLEESKRQLREEVQHLRMLTENVIDEIKKWRDDLGKIQQRPVYYTDSLQNYLVKILNDNKFIFSSKLSGALAFGQKNDPFILVPVKKAEGKEASLFLQIVKLTKDISHYQKYMEYLASQKAYELAINAPVKVPQGYKNPVVQKIYKPSLTKQAQPFSNKEGQEEDSYKKMETLKMRQQRLKKNEERIKSIKSIYQTSVKKDEKGDRNYASQRKIPETDTQDKRGIKKRTQNIKLKKMDPSDIEFQSLVKNKLQAEKSEKEQKRRNSIKISHSKSTSKLPKTEEKMIESLRDIQSTLRNKLQVIQQQDKTQVGNNSLMSSTQQRFTRKNNQDIIKELKAQILGKIQKQAAEKQKLKKLKREQQQKALEQIKQKLKKEMQQKLEQKKREKMLQRQQLQRKLKQEQQRLNSQRQLQLQLQIKLQKQRQLRELQKIKRQALQREKKYKEQLQKQQFLRKQQQYVVENERKEKQRLIEELRKKELKEQIEDQLRKQIKSTNIVKDKTLELKEQDLIRTQKQAELAKQLQLLKVKEGVEMQQLKKENDLRERMLKLKKEQEELKRKQIQHLMRSVVQQQKQHLEQDTVKQRIQLQERMRANVKEKLLQQYKNQKEARIEQIKHERQAQLQQEVYREKIRQKIEKQMRIQAIQRTKKDLQERENKKYEIRSKLQTIKSKFDKQVNLDKQKIQQEVKKQMIQKVIFDKQAEKEAAKYDLRMQFEKDLMASAIPQIYQNKDSFLVKNINYFQGDLHLNSKINQLKPTNQKPLNQSPTKKKPQKGQIKQMIDSMTLQQLQVYQKQKQKVSEIKEQKVIVQAKLPYEQQGFQKLNIVKQKKEEQGYQVKVMRMKQKPKKQEKKQKYKSKQKKQKQSSSQIDSEDEVKKIKQSKKNKKRYYQEQASEDSEDVPKKKKKEKKRKQTSSDQSESEKKSRLKNKKRQSEGKEVQKSQHKSKISPVKQQKKVQKQLSEKAVVYFDAENKINPSPIEPVTIKPQKVSNISQKYKISLQAIPQAQFDQYLSVHLSSVTPVQLAIQVHNREDLYRKLIGQLTFCLLVGQFEGRVIGQALAYHDRTRSDIRKFNIIHLGTYKDEYLSDFVLSVTNYIFRKDPCDEIQFHYKFNEANNDELALSQSFNKWFDKYGSVFQKKTDETNFERKYLLKRQFNQKSQVVLGGINKNTFRNLFSVYCGVLMSDTDMLQFKEELIDTLAPQTQVCYSLMVAQLFRTYLSPDEAQMLKNKVKQFVKLKQMLILVVSMQKKKLKLQQLKLYEYKSLIELNMRLMSQGKQVIRYCKDSATDLNRLYYSQLNHAFNLPFHFQTTSLPVQATTQGEIRQISYFRLSPLPPFKLHIIKSSLYNAQMNILPTQNSKYKIFVLNAQEYNQIREANNLDLFMYIRLFLKNVKSHNVAVWKYVWLPQMTDKGAWNLRQFRNFLNKDFYTHDTINISYRQFLPGALIIQPEHRDLVITPPFIVGVMSMNLEQVSQGSPLYARMIQVNALKTLEIEK